MFLYDFFWIWNKVVFPLLILGNDTPLICKIYCFNNWHNHCFCFYQYYNINTCKPSFVLIKQSSCYLNSIGLEPDYGTMLNLSNVCFFACDLSTGLFYTILNIVKSTSGHLLNIFVKWGMKQAKFSFSFFAYTPCLFFRYREVGWEWWTVSPSFKVDNALHVSRGEHVMSWMHWAIWFDQFCLAFLTDLCNFIFCLLP